MLTTVFPGNPEHRPFRLSHLNHRACKPSGVANLSTGLSIDCLNAEPDPITCAHGAISRVN